MPYSHGASPKRRKLDDEELDSGDDEDRSDRPKYDKADGSGDEEHRLEAHSQNVVDIRVARHPVPRPSDGEVSACWCSWSYVRSAHHPSP